MTLRVFKWLVIACLCTALLLAVGVRTSAASDVKELAALKKQKREFFISTITDARETCVFSHQSSNSPDYQECFRTNVKSGLQAFFLNLNKAKKDCALEPIGEQRQICTLNRFLNSEEAESATTSDSLPVKITSLDDFSRCLTAAGVTFYGADWCPHCLAQKKLFGDSFRLISAVDCVKDADECQKTAIEGYPTWVLKDKTRLLGTQSLDALGESSGCELQK